ncbi:rhamnan synthesis F family protein [Tissierella praeacuta]|uniref:rhamnan synthesis F family protein n=1 Tax=Tissierella praeacuta TaxID=43131 RepID=UPI0033406E8A
MILGKNPKRIAFYVFYDKDGILDDFVSYQVADLKKNVDHILFLANGKLTYESRKKIQPFVDEIFVRENEGFEVEAYRKGIELTGWDKLAEYDELIMMNDTCFGPIYPFKEAFDWAAAEDLDFWGLTTHGEMPVNIFTVHKYNYIPEHIQSSFLVIRNSLLTSREYHEFWKQLPQIKSYGDSVGYYETVFTKDFRDKGYKAEVYCNSEDLKKVSYYPLMFMPTEMAKNRRCPVFKRKVFFGYHPYEDRDSGTFGGQVSEFIRFLEEETEYDMNMVWDNLLRTCHMEQLKHYCNFNRVLPYDYSVRENNSKVLIVVHIYYNDLTSYVVSYLKNAPEYCDILITVSNEENKQTFIEESKKVNLKNNTKFIMIENRGRDVSALLIGAYEDYKNYDLVFFLHDKKTVVVEPWSIGASWQDKCFENLLGTPAYIENIVSLFEKEKRLGMAFPPSPFSASNAYAWLMTWQWTDNYSATEKLIKDFKLSVPISPDREPVAPLGTMFVFRPKALEKLFDGYKGIGWKYEDFPKEPNGNNGTLLHAIERGYPYFVQEAGYYVCWLLNSEWAQVELQTYYYGWYKERMQVSDIKWDQNNNGICSNGEVNAIKNSTSWKVTKPLRAFGDLLVKLHLKR